MIKKENSVEVSVNNDNIEDIKKCDKNMIFSKYFVLCNKITDGDIMPDYIIPRCILHIMETKNSNAYIGSGMWYRQIAIDPNDAFKLNICGHIIHCGNLSGVEILETECLEFMYDNLDIGDIMTIQDFSKTVFGVELNKLYRCISFTPYQYGSQEFQTLFVDLPDGVVDIDKTNSLGLDPTFVVFLIESYVYFYTWLHQTSPSVYRDRLSVSVYDEESDSRITTNYRLLMEKLQFYEKFSIFSQFTDENQYNSIDPVVIRSLQLPQTRISSNLRES